MRYSVFWCVVVLYLLSGKFDVSECRPRRRVYVPWIFSYFEAKKTRTTTTTASTTTSATTTTTSTTVAPKVSRAPVATIRFYSRRNKVTRVPKQTRDEEYKPYRKTKPSGKNWKQKLSKSLIDFCLSVIPSYTSGVRTEPKLHMLN